MYAGNLSQLGRSDPAGAEVRLPLDADVCGQEDLGELEGEGGPLQAPHGRVRELPFMTYTRGNKM